MLPRPTRTGAAPDWEVYVDTVDGRDGERIIWHRSETVPILPHDRIDAAG